MKKIISLVLVFVLCLSLAACGISEEELIGTWVGSWSYKGNDYTKAFVLDGNGTYASIMYKNGDFHELEEGTWEIDGREVELHPDGNEGMSTPHKYKGGKLYNGDHEFVKE